MKHGQFTNVAGRRHQSSGSDAVQSVNCCSTSTEIVRKIKRAVKIAGIATPYKNQRERVLCIRGRGWKVNSSGYVQELDTICLLACYILPCCLAGVGQHRDPSLRRVRRGLGVAVSSVERSALAGTVDTALRSCPHTVLFTKGNKAAVLSYIHTHIVRCFVIYRFHPA